MKKPPSGEAFLCLGDVGDGEGFRPFSFYIEVIDDGC